MPQPEGVPVAAPPVAEARADDELAVVQSDGEPDESGDVSLTRSGDGHFYAEGDVEGTRMRFWSIRGQRRRVERGGCQCVGARLAR